MGSVNANTDVDEQRSPAVGTSDFDLFHGTVSRRDLLAGAAAFGLAITVPAELAVAADGKKAFTILHTNDMHSNFIGMGPASDYTPLKINDDQTTGGYARIAAVIAARRKARESEGPVLILDAGDFSMGTAFAAASREIGGELQLMSHMGYDAATFGNHEFDLGPDGLGKAIGVARKAVLQRSDYCHGPGAEQQRGGNESQDEGAFPGIRGSFSSLEFLTQALANTFKPLLDSHDLPDNAADYY